MYRQVSFFQEKKFYTRAGVILYNVQLLKVVTGLATGRQLQHYYKYSTKSKLSHQNQNISLLSVMRDVANSQSRKSILNVWYRNIL